MTQAQVVTIGDKVDDTVNKVNLNVTPGAQIISQVTSSTSTQLQTTLTITVPTNSPIVTNAAVMTLSHQNVNGQNVWIIGQ